jgi:hypothetical protein
MVRSYDSTAYPFASVPLTLNQWVSIGVFVFAVLRLARGAGGTVPART